MALGKRLILLLSILFVFCSTPPQGIVVLCAGDSLTAADYPRHLRRLLSRDGFRVRVLNHGRKGNTSGEYLSFLRQHQSELGREHPDFILLQLGTNDVRADGDFTPAEAFVGNMKNILAVFREFRDRRGEKSQILLATIPPLPENFSPPFGPRSRQRVSREINPLIAKLAADENLVLVDNYSLFLKFPQFLPAVHPSGEGYRLMAENWYAAIRLLLPK